MKERPILFSGEMVRAILDGWKTMTRRVVKPQPRMEFSSTGPMWGHVDLPGYFAEHVFGSCAAKLLSCPYGQPSPYPWQTFSVAAPPATGWYEVCWEPGDSLQTVWLIKSEHGWSWGRHEGDDPEAIELDIRDPGSIKWRQPGDLLWVKQPWLAVGKNERTIIDNWREAPCFIGRYTDGPDIAEVCWPPTRWRSARFMPKVAACLWLRVTGVRVERVQEISAHDSAAEGVGEVSLEERQEHGWSCGDASISRFRRLWDSINAKRGYGWDVNPWVWVILFELINDRKRAKCKEDTHSTIAPGG